MTLLEEARVEEIIGQLRNDLEQQLQRRINKRSDRFLIERAIAGGKRLRPLLLLVTFKALGGRDYVKALDVACALELAHSASLVHDDILDLDYKRRGSLALWRQIGVGKALLEGHRIINLAFETVLEKGMELARIFVEAWDKASRGILEEIIASTHLTTELYLRIIREKTASLFEAATESAAVLADANENLKNLIKKYGCEVGTAYQLADDLAESIKRRRYGRMLYVFHEMRDRVLRAFIASKTGRMSTLVSALSPKTPSEEFLLKEIARRINAAQELASSALIPDSPYKRVLIELPAYFVKQMLKEAA